MPVRFRCIYCAKDEAACTLWKEGGGAACETCAELARDGGLKALDVVRVDRWLRAQFWSTRGRWMHVLKHTPAGEEIAKCMVHLHQHRGNVWLRQTGWISIFPMSDPAPAWRSAVAGPNGFSDHMLLPQFQRIVRNCGRVAEESVHHVRECERKKVSLWMFCRLMMMEWGDSGG